MKKKEQVWIVVNKKNEPYVDHRYTRKAMRQHHCDTQGYIKWSEALKEGDKCVKAILQYIL